MFGLVERRRLAKYERTLRRAKTDVVGARILYADALMRSLNMVRAAVQHPDALELRNTLSETIEAIPLPYLSDIDALLVRTIKKPRSSQHGQVYYQMPILLNGLIYAHLVEVTKPKFAARAYAFRLDALGFMEPLLQDGREILRRRGANR
jgi:hypothetical protein